MKNKHKSIKIITRSLIILCIIFVTLFAVLFFYSGNPYKALAAMDINIDNLDLTSVTYYEDKDEFRYTVANPLKQIVFIPGGLVEPESYKYLASSLAAQGYNVTIFRPYFDLAILTPNHAKRFLSDDLDNIIIGHSLGGVVGSMVASNNELVSKVVFLGSYPIKDLTDKDVLIITAENDLGMDPVRFDESLKYVKDNTVIFEIIGGNHAQFGWYGPQKGDGDASITTLEQQNIVIQKIIDFIS